MRSRFRFITFILLLSLPPLGCGILYTGENMLVGKLSAILLTTDDVPTMKLDPVVTGHRRGVVKYPPVLAGFEQSWNGTRPEELIYVNYWLFQSVRDAQKAADVWRSFIAAAAIEVNGRIESAYQPELNPEDVIGDATWRVAGAPEIWFVKNNVLVYIIGRRSQVDQRQLTRAVARKIEAKINAALPKNTD